tara:strand:- start:122 stop:652 length:531 start_codon:yes stop_codon:yes gene_type:complete
MGWYESESFVSRDTKEREEELKKNPIDPNQPVWEGADIKGLGLDSAKAGAQWGSSGAKLGFQLGGVAGAAIGGAIGLSAGLIGGAIMSSSNQMDSFQASVEAFKIKTAADKEKAKMAKIADREALRSAKQAAGKSGRAPDLQPIAQADNDIMSMMQAGGVSQYDAGMNRTFGYGVA